jgi:aryl-alcohol dehydrogenase-like predicted oxidoreductase
LEKDETAAGEVINFLLDHGANVIDTAECYGCAEGMIGRTVGHRCNEYAAVVQRIRQAFGQSRESWPGLT